MPEPKKKIRFPQISPRSWEHPSDRAALSALKEIPGLDTILKKVIGITTEKSLRLLALSSSVRVSEKQFPRIGKLMDEVCSILDPEEVPEVYVSESPFLNASVIGVEHPFITLNSSIVGSLNDKEVQNILAHELSHCISGHVLYKTLMVLLLNLSLALTSFPLGGVAISVILGALREWDRRSELSADRAALLVTQDPDICYHTLMKMAGGADLKSMDLDSFIEQAQEYEEAGSLLDSTYKMINLWGRSHPFPVLRLNELIAWVDSGQYDDIMAGNYLPRSEEDKESSYQNFKDAASHYYDDVKNSKDSLAGLVSSIGEGIESVVDKSRDFFDQFGKKD